MNGFDEDLSNYVLCCLISNFEAFRLLNLEVFEALLLIKKLLIKKLLTGCITTSTQNPTALICHSF